uniref:G-protein coupled receptors family 1 profile domain-containing protein n=1 Tax=Esox lucius TaxID=8010 RepID=A0A6Q2Y438_ESOLU
TENNTRWNDSSTLIHPPGFYIIGFTTLPFANLYFIFLAFVHVVTVLFNTMLIYIITVDHRLHNPKFMAVGNLAVVDLLLNTCIIPGMLKTFLLLKTILSRKICASSRCMFSMLLCLWKRAPSLYSPSTVWLPFVNTMTRMLCILGCLWTFCLSLQIFSTSIMTWLSYCNSVNVYSYFCDYAPVFRLACNDNTLQWAMASALSILFLNGPLSFIILSYVSILIAVYRMKSMESRVKALATCTEHIILVAITFIPMLTIFLVGLLAKVKIDPDLRVLRLSLATCTPPCLNPIVYSLKTKEIKSKVVAILFRVKVQAVDT